MPKATSLEVLVPALSSKRHRITPDISPRGLPVKMYCALLQMRPICNVGRLRHGAEEIDDSPIFVR